MLKVYNMMHKMIGLDERKDNKKLRKFLSITKETDIDPSKIAWCAASIGAALAHNGMEGTGSLMARSYLKWGVPVNSNDVKKGDIVVLKRGNSSWQGHVSQFDSWGGWRKQKVNLLGGNQGNKVCIRGYNVKSILDIRRHK